MGLNFLVQPVWYDWNNYDTTHDIYDEPENTIEVVFLGASTTVNGITPMELYEDYGICGYNLGTEQQPVAVSYYWLEEIYRLQGESLKAVVFDASMLRREAAEAFYRKGLDAMELSSAKWNAVRDYTDGSLTEMLTYLIPIMSYHDRWTELGESDYVKTQYETRNYMRGYNFTMSSTFDTYGYLNFGVLNYYPDAETEEMQLNTASLYYMKKMIDFCEEHDLDLVLVRNPRSGDSALHNAIQTIADDYSLDFLDFTCEPLVSEIGYDHATDSADGGHMNYYGASKLTSWLGNYLMEKCGLTDVRGRSGYQFMDEQLEEYHENVTAAVELRAITNLSDYLSSVVSHENYMVFLTVMDEGSAALTEEQRNFLASLGLEKLSELQYRDSYLAVIDGGNVLVEQTEADPAGNTETTVINNELENITIEDVRESRDTEEEESVDTEALVYEGNLPDGTSYALSSAGLNLGNTASVKIGDTEYAVGSRGINIVVYNTQREEVVDSVVFDTCVTVERESQNVEEALETALAATDDITTLSSRLLKLYKYQLLCEDARCSTTLNEAENGNELTTYLDTALQNERYAVFLSVMDEAAASLGSSVRESLGEMGFEQLSDLKWQDSYLAVAIGGELAYEMKDHGENPLTIADAWTADGENGILYSVTSGGMDSGNVSSIIINGTEYSGQGSGINIVVWDTFTGKLVDTALFGSGAEVY